MNQPPLFAPSAAAPTEDAPSVVAPAAPKPRRKLKDHPLARVGAWFDDDGKPCRVDRVTSSGLYVSALEPAPYYPRPSLERKERWYTLQALRHVTPLPEADAIAREAKTQAKQADAYAAYRAERERCTRRNDIYGRALVLARRIATWADDDVSQFERVQAAVDAIIESGRATHNMKECPSV